MFEPTDYNDDDDDFKRSSKWNGTVMVVRSLTVSPDDFAHGRILTTMVTINLSLKFMCPDYIHSAS